MNAITDFDGAYEFLSNFHEVPVTYEGITYGSSEKLSATGQALLVEGNTWRDTFWGFDVNLGYGVNMLGQILMRLRAEHQGKL